MKPMPDADEHRRRAKVEAEKAHKLPPGREKEIHLQNARDHESSAYANDWRDSNLRAPE